MPKKKKDAEQEILETIHAKHVFTDGEINELARQLARTNSEIGTLEAEKSAVSKDFAGRIETKEIHRGSLSANINNGYEMRPTECLVELDPKNRSKDYYRREKDGSKGEFLERREMTQADFQLSLPATTEGEAD